MDFISLLVGTILVILAFLFRVSALHIIIKRFEWFQKVIRRRDIVADESTETITFRLLDGTIHRQAADDDSSYQLINFRSYDVQPDLTSADEDPAEKIGRKKRPKEMPSGQLW